MTTPSHPSPSRSISAPLRARATPFSAIPRQAWDRLFAVTPAATPFSRWTVHRAWWDAYGTTAHEQYLVCLDQMAAGDDLATDPEGIRAIVPLMHRHEVEPEDEATATSLRIRGARGCTDVPPGAKAVFFGAAYHLDYATVLAAPADLPAVAASVAQVLASDPRASHGPQEWDVVDLRRLREVDPALPSLREAFEALAVGQDWCVLAEQEDVCPVLTFPDGDWETYLSTLQRKDRHEIRRKIRRAEEVGELHFELLPPTAEAVETFIALHQERWGVEGLFPPTEGGARSRRFILRLAELEASEGEARQLQLGQLSVAGRPVFAAVGFDDGVSCYFYNAGSAKEARELAPGVTGTAAYLRDRLEAGRRRFDFLRGDEPYKYEWGARDEPIHRLLVTRTGEA